MKRILLLLLSVILLSGVLKAQVYSNKVVGQKNQELTDSLKKTEYPYLLPIWGAKAAEKGFDLPYSGGVGVNYFWQESQLIIEDLLVGFNNGPMYDIDELVRINDAVASANAVNFRPDIWILPFLNVYGLFTRAKTSTSIDAGVWLPDAENNWNEVSTFSTKAEFDATGIGIGMTPTVGIGGGWLALDMNVTWQDISALEKPVFTFVFGPRIGKTFQLKKPQSNIALWAGGFRFHLKSETAGSLNLNELLPVDQLQARVDNGIATVESTQIAVDDWWNGLTPAEQRQPTNIARHETADRVLTKAGALYESMDAALNDEQYASVQYSLQKRPKDMWNMIIGAQYQLNKHWMIRGEGGFLASRSQFIGGLQYRFGL